ncbi:MAG: lactate utilization protein [Thermoleophilia bacterium]|nr:lactate utilization protein [Thermoleophilia bacterium]MDH4344994.1 lactate utilization protein [Thermoleophilia bacterium]MDH5333368.1 lactate utilization protein [Thermoleophilia bacterium]
MRELAARSARPVAFPSAAEAAVTDEQTRTNVRLAQDTIRARRVAVAAELDDWEALRDAGAALRDRSLSRLRDLLPLLEDRVTRSGGVVHWARDAEEANEIVVRVARAAGAREVLKVKSLTTDEIGLNAALERAGLRPLETDLAELVCQLADERPSHLLVPAIHKNRTEIRDLFRERLGLEELTDEPRELAEAARAHLRAAFLRAKVAISGANAAVAETGTVCVVESEGNGRMCTTLADTLITVMGIEKVVAEWRDLEVLLQLLPRSATGERMNPYTSLWTGVREGDGPRAFHLVLLDAGRTRALADPVARPVLRCIRCSACINACPVYRQTGGHAYHTVYAGPIGAILEPQLAGPRGQPGSLPFASSLCGACADVCPVRIDIPGLLVHERGRVVRSERQGLEGASLRLLGRVFASRERYERAQRLARRLQRPAVREGRVRWFVGPLAGWGSSRELPAVPPQTFREWWADRDRA